MKIAKIAKKLGVKRFIYSSSQSMYGISKEDEELDEDKSKKKPLTIYAKTKWDAECNLKKIGDDEFTVVCFRPSTVFGVSPSLRCDIVYNNLVACAYTTGKIEIKSDGTPWRPVIHVRDVSSAFIAGLEAPKKIVSNKTINASAFKGIKTKLKLDFQLMVNNPEKHIEKYLKLKPYNITFHVEACKDILKCIKKIKSKKVRVGLGLNPETPVENVLAVYETIREYGGYN